jgi:hypothetical protein
MKNNQLIILFNKIDVPIEKDNIEYEKAFQHKINDISHHFLQFKESRYQKALSAISIEKLNRPWENENKIYETIGKEFKDVRPFSFISEN